MLCARRLAGNSIPSGPNATTRKIPNTSSWVRKIWNKSASRCRTLSNEKGKVLILVAPSGGGKSTMAERLLKDFDKLHFSVSATTRPPRPGEVEGRDYQFLSDQEFKQKIEEGEFLRSEERRVGKEG